MNLSFTGLLNLLAATFVLLLSYINRSSISFVGNLSNIIGLFVVYAGMAIVIWATIHLKQGIMGGVKPVIHKVIKSGPYKFIRHPVYLGMTIALSGLPIIMESWMGIIAVFILFLPSEIYRARLEEKALSNMFKQDWEKYKSKTGFMLPFLNI